MGRRLPGATASRLQALVTVARAVGTAVAGEQRLAHLLAQVAADQLGGGATVWLAGADGDPPACAAAAHASPDAALRVETPAPDHPVDGVVAEVMAAGVGRVLGPGELPAGTTDAGGGLDPWLPARGLGAVAAVPIRGEERVVGVLAATRDAGGARYTADDAEFLQALADVAAATLAAAELINCSIVAVEDTRRQAELVDRVSDVIIAWDNKHRVVTWNAAAERVYLYSTAEALGCDTDTLLATRFIDADGADVSRDQILAGLDATGGWSGELRQRRADGQEVELLCSMTGLFDWHGVLTGAVEVNRDVTEQRHKERLALRDALTGLPNRRFLTGHLDAALARCASGEEALAVLFMDLDGFKEINDTLGHEAGDEVLRITAQRLADTLRRCDIVARVGGDEFVAVTEGILGRSTAEDIARRLLESTGQPIRVLDTRDVTVLPSIGIAVVTSDRAAAVTSEELVRQADGAMYVAKRGRSGLSFAA
ncbi:MAG TPA: diguanylate cyclase [Pilimelia sp.]|nr:diguanylate cyclase [Pilimelia sp.]